MERVRATLLVKRYSLRTEKTYCYWIRFSFHFYEVRQPALMTNSDSNPLHANIHLV
ncbi:phage integrase N-terminal SAM-like domain-containing protein [Halomonas dongshanensis]|uniref:phage integrase N-terminal SAM-like domain-containing protein n=1 Tax=Halomonas dongshanensis TaxID=2890835 RepID=UPI0031F3BDE6